MNTITSESEFMQQSYCADIQLSPMRKSLTKIVIFFDALENKIASKQASKQASKSDSIFKALEHDSFLYPENGIIPLFPKRYPGMDYRFFCIFLTKFNISIPKNNKEGQQ